jgi:hypothetical protein
MCTMNCFLLGYTGNRNFKASSSQGLLEDDPYDCAPLFVINNISMLCNVLCSHSVGWISQRGRIYGASSGEFSLCLGRVLSEKLRRKC